GLRYISRSIDVVNAFYGVRITPIRGGIASVESCSLFLPGRKNNSVVFHHVEIDSFSWLWITNPVPCVGGRKESVNEENASGLPIVISKHYDGLLPSSKPRHHRPSSCRRIQANPSCSTYLNAPVSRDPPLYNMAASTVPRFSTASTYHLRHCPQLPVSRLPAISRPASPCETLSPATRISLSAATAPTHLRSHRRATSPPSAMASEATSAATAASGKQGLLVFDSEEELSVSLAKYTAELSAKFVRERGAFTVVLSGGSLIQSLRFGS
ncbi:hypothetical protein B296_00037020, partial [Ensete ventricosum]